MAKPLWLQPVRHGCCHIGGPGVQELQMDRARHALSCDSKRLGAPQNGRGIARTSATSLRTDETWPRVLPIHRILATWVQEDGRRLRWSIWCVRCHPAWWTSTSKLITYLLMSFTLLGLRRVSSELSGNQRSPWKKSRQKCK